MSVLLMSTAKAFVRELFTPQQVVDIEYYGGEFSTAEDVVLTGFKCPAILIAGLGWGEAKQRLFERIESQIGPRSALPLMDNSE